MFRRGSRSCEYQDFFIFLDFKKFFQFSNKRYVYFPFLFDFLKHNYILNLIFNIVESRIANEIAIFDIFKSSFLYIQFLDIKNIPFFHSFPKLLN